MQKHICVLVHALCMARCNSRGSIAKRAMRLESLPLLQCSPACTSRPLLPVLTRMRIRSLLPACLQVTLVVLGTWQPEQICNTSAATSLLCEYSFKGQYQGSGNAQYQCCPHGATALQVNGCPTTPP